MAACGFSSSAVILFLSLFCLVYLHPAVNRPATGMSHLLPKSKNILLNQHPFLLWDLLSQTCQCQHLCLCCALNFASPCRSVSDTEQHRTTGWWGVTKKQMINVTSIYVSKEWENLWICQVDFALIWGSFLRISSRLICWQEWITGSWSCKCKGIPLCDGYVPFAKHALHIWKNT